MNISIQWEELMPTTVSGHAVKVTYVYSSFEKSEIDALKEKLKEDIGCGILSVTKDELDVSEVTDYSGYPVSEPGKECANCQEWDCFGCKVKEIHNDL